MAITSRKNVVNDEKLRPHKLECYFYKKLSTHAHKLCYATHAYYIIDICISISLYIILYFIYTHACMHANVMQCWTQSMCSRELYTYGCAMNKYYDMINFGPLGIVYIARIIVIVP